MRYIPFGCFVEEECSSDLALLRIVNAMKQSRIFLHFLQLLRGRDQRFKPCETQICVN